MILAVDLLAHGEKLAMVNVSKVLEILDRKVIPLHEEDTRHEAVSDYMSEKYRVRWDCCSENIIGKMKLT